LQAPRCCQEAGGRNNKLMWAHIAGFLMRLFMIQHDCGHGSFFCYRLANDWVARFLGVLTLTPYDDWRRAHAIHHASSGYLDRRGVGDIDTLTVREFQTLAFWGRVRYRLYRQLSLSKIRSVVLMMQTSKNGPHLDAPGALNEPSNRRILAE
jgi:fatty acid desaturase